MKILWLAIAGILGTLSRYWLGGGMAWATVLKGSLGFGVHSRLHRQMS